MLQAPTWLKNELKEGIALDNGDQEDTQDDSGSEEADSETEETDNGKTGGILGLALVWLNAREPGGQCYKGFTLVFYKSSYCLPC